MVAPGLHAAHILLDALGRHGDAAVFSDQEGLFAGVLRALGIAHAMVAGGLLHLLAAVKVLVDDFALGGIVMQGADIRFGLLPAVVGGYQADGVKRAAQLGQHARGGLLRFVGIDLAHAPGFVERHPGDDAGVIVIACDKVGQRIGQVGYRLQAVLIAAGHFAPDKQAHLVTPVVEPGVFDLLVLAHAVVAEVLDPLDIRLDGLVAGRR